MTGYTTLNPVCKPQASWSSARSTSSRLKTVDILRIGTPRRAATEAIRSSEQAGVASSEEVLGAGFISSHTSLKIFIIIMDNNFQL